MGACSSRTSWVLEAEHGALVFREWINERSPQQRELLHGGVITVAGCRPVVGTKDLRLGTRGVVWDIYITVTLALAGASPRTLYVHPSSKGKLECITEATDDERAVALAALRTRGVSDKIHALYPELRPAVRRKGPQEHIGSEQVQALLMGGRRAAHAQGGAAAGFGLGTVSSQAALATAGASSSSAGQPLPPPALPPAAVAPTSGVSASASAAQRSRRRRALLRLRQIPRSPAWRQLLPHHGRSNRDGGRGERALLRLRQIPRPPA